MSEQWLGKPVVKSVNEETRKRVEILKEKGVNPMLAIVSVGNAAASTAYERNAIKRCESVGITVRNIHMEAESTTEEVLKQIDALNEDNLVHGILLMSPLPDHIPMEEVTERIDPKKDVDGVTTSSMAAVYAGKGVGFAPCTAEAVLEMMKFYNFEVKGKNITVVGKGLASGKPLIMLLLNRRATVTGCHTGTINMPVFTKAADLVVTACGVAEMFGKEYFREGQIIVDVGVEWSDEKQKIVGDVNYEEVEPTAAAITPVPGGVGLVTTTVLAKHVAEAAEATL